MKKKDIDAVYEENPAEDATAEEKASGKKKKSKKRNCPEERKKPGNDTLGQKKVQFRKDNFTLLKTKNSVAAKSENFSTSGDRGEILRFRFV